MRRADGTPWIHSFAHGRTVYELKHNAARVRAAMNKSPSDAVVKTFVELTLIGDLNDEEIEVLRNEAAKRSGLTKRTVTQMLKDGAARRVAKRRQQQRERQLAERDDPRPQSKSPERERAVVAADGHR